MTHPQAVDEHVAARRGGVDRGCTETWVCTYLAGGEVAHARGSNTLWMLEPMQLRVSGSETGFYLGEVAAGGEEAHARGALVGCQVGVHSAQAAHYGALQHAALCSIPVDNA